MPRTSAPLRLALLAPLALAGACADPPGGSPIRLRPDVLLDAGASTDEALDTDTPAATDDVGAPSDGGSVLEDLPPALDRGPTPRDVSTAPMDVAATPDLPDASRIDARAMRDVRTDTRAMDLPPPRPDASFPDLPRVDVAPDLAPPVDAPAGCSLPCATAARWNLSAPTEVMVHTGGDVSLVRTVPTPDGWGIFWQRDEPATPGRVQIYYARVDAAGALLVRPVRLLDLPRLAFRGQYYAVDWHTDHFGMIVSDNTTVGFHNLAPGGELSPRVVVGPRLLVSTVFSNEARSQLDAFPGGFLGVIEGDCSGHSCAYAFRLGPRGAPMGSVYNLVDLDGTHQFWPVAAFDGAGFAIESVKDVTIPRGGVTTRYLPATGAPTSPNVKVVPAKEYLWDENPDLAWNGSLFGSLWTEVTARPPSMRPPVSWQVRFAAFRRTAAASTLAAERILEVWPQRSGHGFSNQIHGVGCDFLVQYTRWRMDMEPLVVFQWLDAAGRSHATLTPFPANTDALGSSVATAGPAAGRIGLARGYNAAGAARITFHLLDRPVCAP